MSNKTLGLDRNREDLRGVCRVCMSDAGVVNIFKVSCVLRMIRHCVMSKISETDGLPVGICRLCLRSLKIAYRFQIQYEESHRELLRIFSIKTEDIKLMKEERNDEVKIIKEEISDVADVKVEFVDSIMKQVPHDINSTLSKICSLRGVNIKPVKRKNTKKNTIPQNFIKTRRKSKLKNIAHKNRTANSVDEKLTSKNAIEKRQIIKINNSSGLETNDGNKIGTEILDFIKFEDQDDWTPAPDSPECPIPDYFKCQFCPASFTTNEEYDTHYNFHMNETETCDVCHKTIRGRRNILRHHGVHDKYPCELCGKMLHKYDLSKHVRHKHTDWQKECPVCHVVLTGREYFRIVLHFGSVQTLWNCSGAATS